MTTQVWLVLFLTLLTCTAAGLSIFYRRKTIRILHERIETLKKHLSLYETKSLPTLLNLDRIVEALSFGVEVHGDQEHWKKELEEALKSVYNEGLRCGIKTKEGN